MEISQADHNLELEDFEYELPEHLIAAQPLEQREKSRLLVVHRESGMLEHRVFEELPEILTAGDLLVINNTKVIPVRLNARNAHGANIELLLLKPEVAAPAQWEAMASPLRKLKEGEQLTVEAGSKQFTLQVVGFCSSADGQRRVLVDLGSKAQVPELLAAAGLAPLPPYINKVRERQHETNRNATADQTNRYQSAESILSRSYDLERYQTVFARAPGAVAAPTAGLHFSHKLLERLRKRGVEIREITLHVGPGTFKPVTTTVREHKVEEESYSIDAQTAVAINTARSQKRRVIAVGTTSCRALESAWTTTSGIMPTENGKTDLYICPGFKFNVIDTLITNFHLSRSSLLIMVSAFAGHSLIKKAYAEAIEQQYRFYSYGDAMLIL